VSLAEIQLANGERDAASVNLERATVDAARMRATDATRNKWNIALTGNLLLRRLAAGGASAPHPPELDTYLSMVKTTESAGKALDAEQVRIVSAAELALGDLLARDAPSEARARWQATVDRIQQPAAAGDLPAMTLLAQARLRLGATAEARALAQRIEASPYRHPAYADLRQRLATAAGAVPAHP
jgi:hypothetical protein